MAAACRASAAPGAEAVVLRSEEQWAGFSGLSQPGYSGSGVYGGVESREAEPGSRAGKRPGPGSGPGPKASQALPWDSLRLQAFLSETRAAQNAHQALSALAASGAPAAAVAKAAKAAEDADTVALGLLGELNWLDPTIGARVATLAEQSAHQSALVGGGKRLERAGRAGRAGLGESAQKMSALYESLSGLEAGSDAPTGVRPSMPATATATATPATAAPATAAPPKLPAIAEGSEAAPGGSPAAQGRDGDDLGGLRAPVPAGAAEAAGATAPPAPLKPKRPYWKRLGRWVGKRLRWIKK